MKIKVIDDNNTFIDQYFTGEPAALTAESVTLPPMQWNSARISGILGGFHLFDANDRLTKTIQYLNSCDIKAFYPYHCVSSGESFLFFSTFMPIFACY